MFSDRNLSAALTTSWQRWMLSTVCGVVGLVANAHAAQLELVVPVGSGSFGTLVTTLPNGNLVVTDPNFDAPGPPAVADVGAVHVYAPDGTLLSTLRGSSAFDQVGSAGVVVLPGGNFVVLSPQWDRDAVMDVGAASFGAGTTGIQGVVSAANSLVGSSRFDRVGTSLTVLAGGNYVVSSPRWTNGAAGFSGAATFGSGSTGVVGLVSPSNSLVGSTSDDQVGLRVTALTNGNYVVQSPFWNRGLTSDAGAATFGSGVTGISGEVSVANSLVGGSGFDGVGNDVIALSNGNYVVRSTEWNDTAAADVGAATLGSGTAGISGPVSPSNSLVGSTAGDRIGFDGITALLNGNYVIRSSTWDHGVALNAGAVSFGSGTTGVAGVVSPTNSLVGSQANDRVGTSGVIALTNGNYVVASVPWDNGAATDAGAATFGSGITGVSGVVSSANSLVGSFRDDQVGHALSALSNGNYVVLSPFWDSSAASSVGAATLGSGSTGVTGPVSPTNSLVGSQTNDRVGFGGVTSLSDGNYVVNSYLWDNGPVADAGAATFASGITGISGVVSSSNSLVGSSANDQIGGGGITALTSGSYVVGSPQWDHGAIVDAGAATFATAAIGIVGTISPANSLLGSAPNNQVGRAVTALPNGGYVVASPQWDDVATTNVGAVGYGAGTTGFTGSVSAANSLIGGSPNDTVGSSGVTPLSNANYLVLSPFYDDGAIMNAGAITLGLADGSVVGAVSTAHSVIGTVASAGNPSFSYDGYRNQLAVGHRLANRVVLHRTGIATAINIVGHTPNPSFAGQPVTFTAAVSATPGAPTNGRVTFAASNDVLCVDPTPTPISATTAEYSCSIAFPSSGDSFVIAEYTGSTFHAYSRSAAVPHTTVGTDFFSDGFECPLTIESKTPGVPTFP